MPKLPDRCKFYMNNIVDSSRPTVLGFMVPKVRNSQFSEGTQTPRLPILSLHQHNRIFKERRSLGAANGEG